jgi:hypothetical protein
MKTNYELGLCYRASYEDGRPDVIFRVIEISGNPKVLICATKKIERLELILIGTSIVIEVNCPEDCSPPRGWNDKM